MCGIVIRPTRRKDFSEGMYRSLKGEIVTTIVGLCEDVHIPHLATGLLLGFVDEMLDKQDFVMQTIPFAMYCDHRRYVTRESIYAEEAEIHLAMAGSVRYFINQELEKLGLHLEMGHCCDIQLHSTRNLQEAMSLSHDGNVYRADKLRFLKSEDTVIVSIEEFLLKTNCRETKKLIQMMHKIVAGNSVQQAL